MTLPDAGELIKELGPLGGVAALAVAVLAFRSPQIIDVFLRHRREQRKVSAKIERDQKLLQEKIEKKRRSRRKK
jgi:hypothetical protein